MKQQHRLIIDPSGGVACVYDDALRPVLHALGRCTTRRASHVEPTVPSRGVPVVGQLLRSRILWTVDLSPSAGPTLGPYSSRRDALEFERIWLERALAAGMRSPGPYPFALPGAGGEA